MSKNICGKQLGSTEYDTCYKELNHGGNCYKTFGLEAEAWMQELLRQCDCQVAKATIHEDHKLKIDFWVYSADLRCNGESANKDFLPIQFTIDKNAACGLKGRDALRQGVVILFIESDDLLEWKTMSDVTLKEVVKLRIYRNFCDSVKRIEEYFERTYIKIAQPMTMLRRFEPEPIRIESQS
ncbi:MAG: hypothetical protein A3D47_02415 [Candidatus Colwellbacteria bacterium RIFCSPHIGHO2_02_FULL_43_15]|nr:MAG: hypothetical protein A3D47_02415 [Candidatus Colwellbacteria bacterium RIFCSPHIGHO2_02_FULL_43_15]OGY61410.1 MAG: hypothetical protein A3F99_00305 [Candidatus Colwellbacteria bacterium RIFCSPLOWO2_12_FULL_43_11]